MHQADFGKSAQNRLCKVLYIYMRSSFKTVIVISISFVFSGLADQYYLFHFGQADITFVPHSLVLGMCLFIWCKQHGREHGITELKFYPLGCGLFGLVGVPVYAFKFFGLKNGVLLLLKAFAALALTVIMVLLITQLTRLIYV